MLMPGDSGGSALRIETAAAGHAVSFPLRKISFEALPVGFVEHRRGSPRSRLAGGMLLVGPQG